jgi:hypothetical protein
MSVDEFFLVSAERFLKNAEVFTDVKTATEKERVHSNLHEVEN